MIETSQLSKKFDTKVAVHDLSLTVREGEIFGFLGPNGAGKSTTVKMLTGMIFPTAGTAHICGYDIAQQPVEVKKRIGYVPESGALFESLTGWEYLRLIADLHHLDSTVAEKRIEEFLTLFGLWEERGSRLQQYSKGMKQKILIAAALIHNPPVLFLDEPMNGLDANAALVFKELLKKFSTQGKTIFFTSHILDVVEKLCTRIVIINNGLVIAEGTGASIAASTGRSTLEEAFSALTGMKDARDSAQDFLEAMGS
ncbi:MAG: ABC transporter ATP-binding protein [Ignavibacteriales bacterium]|nr:ABC transporter ATP-binding protein [Ignavibacteriales bacterium]